MVLFMTGIWPTYLLHQQATALQHRSTHNWQTTACVSKLKLELANMPASSLPF